MDTSTNENGGFDPSGPSTSDDTEASTTNEGQGDGSGLSPEFVKMTQTLVMGASPEQLAYVQQCIDKASAQGSPSGASETEGSPSTYDSSDMPKD